MGGRERLRVDAEGEVCAVAYTPSLLVHGESKLSGNTWDGRVVASTLVKPVVGGGAAVGRTLVAYTLSGVVSIEVASTGGAQGSLILSGTDDGCVQVWSTHQGTDADGDIEVVDSKDTRAQRGSLALLSSFAAHGGAVSAIKVSASTASVLVFGLLYLGRVSGPFLVISPVPLGAGATMSRR